MSNKIDQARHDAAVLPRIRDLEAAGLSLRQIAEQLQEDGFPTPGRRGRWSYMAVQRILDRAGKPPGGGEAASKIPAPVTITVNGPVNTNVPVAHQAGGQVTIQVDATPAPASETKPDEPPTRASLVQVVEPETLYALPPWPPPRGQTLYPALDPLLFPNLLFLRRRA